MLIIFFTIANLIRDLINGKGFIKKYFNVESNVLTEYEQLRNKNIFFHELGEIAYYLIVCFGIIFAITNLGIQTPTILTILGTLIVGISLSMQGTIGNIWAGLYITIANLFNVGDKIGITLVNGKTFTGNVVEFTLFNTVIFEEQLNSQMTIPNSTIQNGLLSNFSKK